MPGQIGHEQLIPSESRRYDHIEVLCSIMIFFDQHLTNADGINIFHCGNEPKRPEIVWPGILVLVYEQRITIGPRKLIKCGACLRTQDNTKRGYRDVLRQSDFLQ